MLCLFVSPEFVEGVYHIKHDMGVLRFGLCGLEASMPCDDALASALLWVPAGGTRDDGKCFRYEAVVMCELTPVIVFVVLTRMVHAAQLVTATVPIRRA